MLRRQAKTLCGVKTKREGVCVARRISLFIDFEVTRSRDGGREGRKIKLATSAEFKLPEEIDCIISNPRFLNDSFFAVLQHL
jgi:hypothetical protein